MEVVAALALESAHSKKSVKMRRPTITSMENNDVPLPLQLGTSVL